MNIWLIFEKVGTVFALIIIGFVFGKIIKGTDTRQLSKLVLNVSVPASIIGSISAADFDAVKTDMLSLWLIALCVLAVTLLAALLYTKLFKLPVPSAAVYRSALFFNNYGFMGWPVCFVLFGQEGLLYAALYSIPLHLVLYVVTPILLTSGKSGFDKRVLINMPLFATLIGIVLLVLRAQLPGFLSDILNMVGDTQTPLSMMIIGIILSAADLKKVIRGVQPYIYSAVRLLLFPIAAFFVLRGLGVSGLVLGVSVVITAMPAGTMVVVLGQKYDADAVLASRLVIISTMLSVITVPLLAMLVL